MLSANDALSQPSPDEGDVLVLLGGTVISGDAAEPAPDSVIVVRDERIEYIGDADSFIAPEGARVLDTSGMWLIPGLSDTHVHMPPDEAQQASIIRRLLAYGITTIRVPGSTHGVEFREKIASRQLDGPRVFTASFMIDPPRGAFGRPGDLSEAEVLEEVRSQVNAGVDFVKLYFNMPPELVKIAIDEAHAHGVKVIGHLGLTSWQQAAEMGIDALTHIGVFGGASWELSSNDDVEPVTDYNDIIELLPTIDFRGAKAAELARTLSRNRVVVDPTLVIAETNTWSDDPSILEHYDPEVGPAWITDPWVQNPHPRARYFSAEAYDRLKDAFPATLDFVRLLHDSGVVLLSGTDTTFDWITPGISLHRELELLNDAGISTADVLRISTYNAALSLGQLESFGTLEPGKAADIIVLRANTITDIRNTREIEWVIKGGQMLNPRELLTVPDPSPMPATSRDPRFPVPLVLVLAVLVVSGAVVLTIRRRMINKRPSV